jgi:hypothetical protein
VFAFGAGKRLGHHIADQHLTGLAGMNSFVGEKDPFSRPKGMCFLCQSQIERLAAEFSAHASWPFTEVWRRTSPSTAAGFYISGLCEGI